MSADRPGIRYWPVEGDNKRLDLLGEGREGRGKGRGGSVKVFLSPVWTVVHTYRK